MNNITPQQLVGPAVPVLERPTFTYNVPESIARSVNIKTVTLVELTADEELFATKRSNNNPIRLAYELAKESLRAVDGKPVSTGDGTADLVWNRMGAKLRTLVITAYNELHNPKETEGADFLKSRQVSVG